MCLEGQGSLDNNWLDSNSVQLKYCLVLFVISVGFGIRIEMYAKRNCTYFTTQFCRFPVCFPPQICIDIIENLFYTSPSHFVLKNACKGGRNVNVTCNQLQWYGWMIALHCMALLYLPSHKLRTNITSSGRTGNFVRRIHCEM